MNGIFWFDGVVPNEDLCRFSDFSRNVVNTYVATSEEFLHYLSLVLRDPWSTTNLQDFGNCKSRCDDDHVSSVSPLQHSVAVLDFPFLVLKVAKETITVPINLFHPYVPAIIPRTSSAVGNSSSSGNFSITWTSMLIGVPLLR